jgi:hypothetical protein
MLIDVDLSGAFDEMLARMQGEDWRQKVDQAFVKQAISGDRNGNAHD